MKWGLIFVSLAWVLSGCSSGSFWTSPFSTQSEPAEATTGNVEYDRLVAKVKESPTKDNLRALREAYVETDLYKPETAREKAGADRAFEAMVAGDLSKCRSRAAAVLEENYVSLDGHFSAMICAQKDGKVTQAAYHKKALTGLLDVILGSGNGKSKKTPFVTISTPELRAFLVLQGAEIVGQDVEEEDGRWFAIISVSEPESGKKALLLFDVTQQKVPHSHLRGGAKATAADAAAAPIF